MKLNELVNSIIFKVAGQAAFREANREVDKLEDNSRDAADGVEELDEKMTKAYRAGALLGRSIRRVGGGLKRLATGILGVIPQALGVSSLSFGALGAAAIAAASNTQEAQSKMRDILGDSSSDLETWAKRNAASFNASTNELRTFATDFAVQFQTLGGSNEDVIERSQAFTARALDLASFSNKNAADVAADFTSALNGSSETVEKYGVNLKEAALTQFILSSGLAKSKKEITENDKRMARYQLILKGTSAASGNAARTSGDFANVLRNLRGRFLDLLTDIGIRLIPLATQALQGLTSFVNKNKDQIVEFFENGAKAVQQFIENDGLNKIADTFLAIVDAARSATGAVLKFVDAVTLSKDERAVNQQIELNRRSEGRQSSFTVNGQPIGVSDAELEQAKKDLQNLQVAEIRRSALINASRATALGGISNFQDPARGSGTQLVMNNEVKVEIAGSADATAVEQGVSNGLTGAGRTLERVFGASGVGS